MSNKSDYDKYCVKRDKDINRTDLTLEDIHNAPFLFIQEHGKNYNSLAKESLKGMFENTMLSNAFFSKANIKIIQFRLKKRVYITGLEYKKKLIISDQDENELIPAMQYVFFTYAKHLSVKIKEQIDDLDNLVVDELIVMVVSNVKQHFAYLEDLYTPMDVLQHPINVSSKGRRLLPSITTILT